MKFFDFLRNTVSNTLEAPLQQATAKFSNDYTSAEALATDLYSCIVCLNDKYSNQKCTRDMHLDYIVNEILPKLTSNSWSYYFRTCESTSATILLHQIHESGKIGRAHV